MSFPDTYWCPEHKRNHKKGSLIYSNCLHHILQKAAASAGYVVFRLKEESPGSVSIRTGSYSKVFSRTMEPFVAPLVIWEKVLLRTGMFVRE